MDERIERVFDITQGDRVNIDLAERVGVAHLAVSYPQVDQVFIGQYFKIITARNNYINNQEHYCHVMPIKLI